MHLKLRGAAQHLKKHDEVCTREVFNQVSTALSTRDETKWRECMRALKLHQDYCGSLSELRSALQAILVPLASAVEINEKGLRSGTDVICIDDGEMYTIHSIAHNFTVRLRNRRGAFHPRSLKIVV